MDEFTDNWPMIYTLFERRPLGNNRYLLMVSRRWVNICECSWCSSCRIIHSSNVTDIAVRSLALLQDVKRIPSSLRANCKEGGGRILKWWETNQDRSKGWVHLLEFALLLLLITTLKLLYTNYHCFTSNWYLIVVPFEIIRSHTIL